MFGVYAAIVGNIPLASFMHIQLAYGTLKALVDQSVEHRTAVVTKGGSLVGVYLEPVRHVDVETAKALLEFRISANYYFRDFHFLFVTYIHGIGWGILVNRWLRFAAWTLPNHFKGNERKIVIRKIQLNDQIRSK